MREYLYVFGYHNLEDHPATELGEDQESAGFFRVVRHPKLVQHWTIRFHVTPKKRVFDPIVGVITYVAGSGDRKVRRLTTPIYIIHSLLF